MGSSPHPAGMAEAVQPKNNSFHQGKNPAPSEIQSFIIDDRAYATCLRAPFGM